MPALALLADVVERAALSQDGEHQSAVRSTLASVVQLLEELCYQGSGRQQDKAAYLRRLREPL
jgi:hypothetical protein